MNRFPILLIFIAALLLIDLYVFQAVRVAVQSFEPLNKKIIYGIFWSLTAVSIGFLLYYQIVGGNVGRLTRTFFFTAIFANVLSKSIVVLFLFIEDITRVIRWSISKFDTSAPGLPLTRSEFLAKTALITASVPVITMGFGIVSGAHDYRVIRKTIALPNLPKSFDGLRIAQISDIHSGSFYNKTAVKGGIDMLLNEKPDTIFFTGDLVNNETDEVKEYFDVFNKVKAPLGVFSILGNHDYGDYKQWDSPAEKAKNLQDMYAAHKELGWDLLLNEHRMLEQNGDKLAIIGVENWGAGRFAKYGKLDVAHAGTEAAEAKILLSHDPSHWDAQVRDNYSDIDLMLAGHTHGFQFGVEVGNFKWSPSQYAYKQWAGLYQKDHQSLYVNRGYGFIGYPGRIGMPPEITIFELKRA